MEENDLPKSIVVILVVLAVVISVLSSFTIMSEINRLNNAPLQQSSTQNAKISLQVVDQNNGFSTTGKVVLNIIKKD